MKVEDCDIGDRLQYPQAPWVQDGLTQRMAPSEVCEVFTLISGTPFVRFDLPKGRRSDLMQIKPGQEAKKL